MERRSAFLKPGDALIMSVDFCFDPTEALNDFIQTLIYIGTQIVDSLVKVVCLLALEDRSQKHRDDNRQRDLYELRIQEIVHKPCVLSVARREV
jgi:hypothetical protein